MHPVGTSRFGRAVAAVTGSRLAMGTAAFHWTKVRMSVDTVYLGCFWATRLRDVGGYDETRLQWGAEDHELNYRLTKGGASIVCDPEIRSWYFCRATRLALWRQYHNYGMGKVSTLVKHRGLPTLRPIAPAALVGGLVTATTMAAALRRTRYLAPVFLWLAAVASIGSRLSREPGVHIKDAMFALAECHTAYGVGVWQGCLRALFGRPFDTQPRVRRVPDQRELMDCP